jgi:hypothetical protein
MDGELEHRHLHLRWTFADDGRYGAEGGDRHWLFEVSLGDIGVARRYPDPLTQNEAEAEARKIAPELFRVAQVWLE